MTVDVMDEWSLTERLRVGRKLNIRAGWKHARSESGRCGFAGVVRRGRSVIWHGRWAWDRENAYESAAREYDRLTFDEWKRERGIQ